MPSNVSALTSLPGVPTIIPAYTSPSRIVYQNPDGTKTATITAVPTRYYDQDSWHDIDLTAVIDGGIIRPRAQAGGVAVEAASGDILVPAPGSPMIIHQTAQHPTTTTADGRTVTVSGGRANGDSALVTFTSAGFKHSVVAQTSASSPSYVLDLELPPYVTAASHGTNVEFALKNVPFAEFGGGVAIDSRGAEAPVTTTLTGQEPGRAVITVAAPAARFRSDDRAFPITIDPDYSNTLSSRGIDTYVNSDNCDGAYSGQTELRTGTDQQFREACGTFAGLMDRRMRTFVRFPSDELPRLTSEVLNGSIDMYAFDSMNKTYSAGTVTTHEASPIYVHALASSPNAQTTWNNQPALATLVWSQTELSASNQWYRFEIPALASQWTTNPAANTGVGIVGEEYVTANNRVRYYSSESGLGPRLTLQWLNEGRPPSAPKNVATATHGASVTVSWDAPTDLGNPALTGYYVNLYVVAASVGNSSILVPTEPSSRSCGTACRSMQYDDLLPGLTYRAIVRPIWNGDFLISPLTTTAASSPDFQVEAGSSSVGTEDTLFARDETPLDDFLQAVRSALGVRYGGIWRDPTTPNVVNIGVVAGGDSDALVLTSLASNFGLSQGVHMQPVAFSQDALDMAYQVTTDAMVAAIDPATADFVGVSMDPPLNRILVEVADLDALSPVNPVLGALPNGLVQIVETPTRIAQAADGRDTYPPYKAGRRVRDTGYAGIGSCTAGFSFISKLQ